MSVEFFDRNLCYTINDSHEEKNYKKGTKLDNVHWGQLKLFGTEMLFLTHYLDVRKTKDILYIGAAPGDHLYCLSKFFPDVTFHLYDEMEFCKKIKNMTNIKIHRRKFEDEDIVEWTGKNLLLISDIRCTSYDRNDDSLTGLKKNEDMAWEDMLLQQRWVEELKPQFSLLKFRLPYGEEFNLKQGKTRNYLDGLIYIQAFNNSSSSETRLVVFGDQIVKRDWDIVSYERKLFHHNSEIRNKKKFKNPLNDQKRLIHPEIGLYNDFDSSYITHVVIDYLEKISIESSETNVKRILTFILNNCCNTTNLIDKR